VSGNLRDHPQALRKDNVIERQNTARPDRALAERAQPDKASLRCSAKRRSSATNNADGSSAVAYTRNKRDSPLKLKRPPLAARGHKETSMTTYFTIADFILIIPMALAGALFLGALPCWAWALRYCWSKDFRRSSSRARESARESLASRSRMAGEARACSHYRSLRVNFGNGTYRSSI
jgi:hypothetical protein